MIITILKDTLGGILKAALAQFLALEIARMSGDRDTKFVSKYLPWLFNPPSAIVAQVICYFFESKAIL